jgi:hypothetical protein
MALLMSGMVAGCSTTPSRPLPLGYACHQSFSYDSTPRAYRCLFELSAPSDFYDDSAIDRVLDALMSSDGGKCTRSPTETFIVDSKTAQYDHIGQKYRMFQIVCK